MRLLAAAVAFLFLAASPRPLTLVVSPRVGVGPQDILLRLTTAPNPANRVMCAGYDGPQSRSSCWEVGVDAPRVVELHFRGLIEGRYVAVGEIRQEGGRVVAVTQEFCVLGNVVTVEECF